MLTYEEFLERVKTEGIEWALSFVEKNKKHYGYIHRSRQKRKEEIAEYMQEYNRRWRETHSEYMRQWLLAHPGYMRQYDQEHAEERAEYSRRYRQEHPEVHRQAARKRRAMKAESDGNFTEEEFRLLCEAFENECIYCHRELPLVADHAIPLARGGSNSIDNIVPACKSCNSVKHNKTFDEFVEWLYRVEVVGES